ncbi:hypothetical protein ACFYT4_25465 [Streptomyces sp. NPDC004609]|uniref:hypothetical protein n=1 Tax=Streptomyces sp. NPDC004609 TaxID=3364704 RepID=UPI0036CC6F61
MTPPRSSAGGPGGPPRERRRNGNPLADLPGIRSKAVRGEAAARIARPTLHHAAGLLDQRPTSEA